MGESAWGGWEGGGGTGNQSTRPRGLEQDSVRRAVPLLSPQGTNLPSCTACGEACAVHFGVDDAGERTGVGLAAPLMSSVYGWAHSRPMSHVVFTTGVHGNLEPTMDRASAHRSRRMALGKSLRDRFQREQGLRGDGKCTEGEGGAGWCACGARGD